VADLEFVQGKGFISYEFPSVFAWAEGEDEKAFAERLRLTKVYDSECDYGEMACGITIYEPRTGSPFLDPGFGVTGLAMVTALHDQYDLIVARSPGDWLALRLQLTSVAAQASALDCVAKSALIAERAFRHRAGHSPVRPCRACMTDEEARREQERGASSRERCLGK
jgi:hypothetical protein